MTSTQTRDHTDGEGATEEARAAVADVESRKSTSKCNVEVHGDQTLDWLYTVTEKPDLRSDERFMKEARAHWMGGGVWLLRRLIEKATWDRQEKNEVKVRSVDLPDVGKELGEPYGRNHSSAMLEKYEDEECKKEKCEGKYRIKEYLGLAESSREPEELSDDPARLDENHVVVIDDAGLGFSKSRGDRWDDLLGTKRIVDDGPWVIVKVSRGRSEGFPLLSYLAEQVGNPKSWLRGRLILLITTDLLRDEHSGISSELSWERTVRDTIWSLATNESTVNLTSYAHLVVSYGPTGALLVSNTLNQCRKPARKLIYAKDAVEADWEQEYSAGRIFGYSSALCASVVRRIAQNPKNPDIESGVRSGIVAMRQMYYSGFKISEGSEPVGEAELGKESDYMYTPGDDGGAKDDGSAPGYGRTGMVSAHAMPSADSDKHDLVREWENLAIIDIPDDYGHGPKVNETTRITTFLDAFCPSKKEILELARNIVRDGSKALGQIPFYEFGDIVTADRGEIEGMRAVHRRILRYQMEAGIGTKPLAIGVFGPPGSGKSKVVTEIARDRKADGSRHSSRALEPLTFNISEYDGRKEFVSALHSVRDVGLDGKIPMALWDEFDAKDLDWLRSFLSPIADGSFRHRDSVHRIGPAIFVFAGGTSHSFEEFRRKASQAPRSTKATDFVSRLQGHIDIPSLNPGSDRDHENNYYIVRRAIILNAMLKTKGIRTRDVAPNVVDAFLDGQEYLHGARSMMAVIEMSGLKNKNYFGIDDLPAPQQLNSHMHDGYEFLDKAFNRPAS